MTERDDQKGAAGEQGAIRNGANIDELAERLRSTKGADEDIVTLLATNWQKIVGAFAVVLLLVWIINEAKMAKENKAGEASQRFQNVQTVFGELGAPKPAEATAKEEAKNGEESAKEEQSKEQTFQDNIKLIEKNYSESIYSKMAPLYLAAADLDKGQLPQVRDILVKNYAADTISNRLNSGEDVPGRVVSELAAVLYGRLLIKEGRTADAQSYLEKLALNASVVNVEALVLLYRTAENEEQRKAAVKTARELQTKKPELADSVKQELAMAGVN